MYFIYLCWILVVAHGTRDLHCGMQESLIEAFDPEQGFESKPRALGTWSLS